MTTPNTVHAPAVPDKRDFHTNYDKMCSARRDFAVAFALWLQESRPGYYDAMEEATGTGQQLRQLTMLLLDGAVA